MKKIYLVSIIYFSLLFHHSSFANVPEGFEELLTPETTKTKIILNDQDFIEVITTINSDTIQIGNDVAEELNDFLLHSYVNPEFADSIISNLLNGVNSSSFCLGHRLDCHISEEGIDDVQYVVVFEEKKLRILVPAAMMSENITNSRYIDDRTGQNALLMHHSLNVNGNDSNVYGFYGNKAVLGAFGGYFKSDLNVTSEDDNSVNGYAYFDELNYNYLHEDMRVRIGYTSDNIDRFWNGTALLDADEDSNMLAVEYGSSRELEFKNRTTAPRLYFSIPSSGRLIVTREDGSPVLERNVAAGQNFISYNDLPSGIQVLNIEVVAGERSIYQETRKIYNTDRTGMDSGDYHFNLSAGKLYEQDVITNDLIADVVDDYQYSAFLESRVAAQLSNAWQVGGSIFSTKEDYFYKVALMYQFNENLSLTGLHGHFNDGSYYDQMSLYFYGINADWSSYKDKTNSPEEAALSNYFFGFGSSKSLTISYNYAIWNGSFYTSYALSKNQGEYQVVYVDEDDRMFSEYTTWTTGYNFNWWFNMSVDLNTTYLDSKNTNGINSDEWQFGLTLSLPLGTDSYANYSLQVADGYQNHRASLGTSYQVNDHLSTSAEVGANRDVTDNDSDTEGDLSLSANYNDDQWRGSGYGYVATDNTYSVYGDFNTSTLFDGDSVYLTSRESDSYLVVENSGSIEDRVDADSIDSDKFLTVANLKGNGDGVGRLALDSDEVVYPIKNYLEYKVNLDEGASDYHNRGESSATGSSYPGTLLSLDVDMREVKSYISVFNDIEGNPIDNVTCTGVGCIDVEELTDGVFKFKVAEGLPFQLRTSNQRCLIPLSSDDSVNQNLGSNFCMPAFNLDDGFKIAKGKNGKYYYYIGEFDDEALVDRYESRLENEPITFIRKAMGSRLFLFIEADDMIEQASILTLESLETYALEEQDNPSYVSK